MIEPEEHASLLNSHSLGREFHANAIGTLSMLAPAMVGTAVVAGKFDITDVQRCENFVQWTTPRKTPLSAKLNNIHATTQGTPARTATK